MVKSADAFRTISEVADWLGVQTHVLRFWESKFTQVKPVKRAGGRRYYRPADMLLLGGIHKLLRDDGMTIKGVQKLLREHGMAYVADLSPALDDATDGALDASLAPKPKAKAKPKAKPTAKVVDLPIHDTPKNVEPDPEPEAAAPADTEDQTETVAAEPEEKRESVDDTPLAPPPPAESPLPAFMRTQAPAQPVPEKPTATKPNVIDAPDDPLDLDTVAAGALTFATRLRRISDDDAPTVKELLTQLAALRDRMASNRSARKE